MSTETALPNTNGTLTRAHAAEVQEQKVAIAPKRRKTHPKKPEDEGLMTMLCALVCDHQIGTVLVVLQPSIGN
tara:strand:- start:16271 stop:16489 length:219 start_codon:yes stop_codon:yes gene_type:complete